MARNKTFERPFKIWDEKDFRNLPWRAYSTSERAINKALTLLYWLELGNSYTVYDERSGKAIKQFVRQVKGLIELE